MDHLITQSKKNPEQPAGVAVSARAFARRSWAKGVQALPED